MREPKKVLLARIDEYAYGVWFVTRDIDPVENTVTIYDHITKKELTMTVDENVDFKEVSVDSVNWEEYK